MTLALLPPPDRHVMPDRRFATDNADDSRYGITAAIQMLRDGDVSGVEFFALCEEAAELLDGDEARSARQRSCARRRRS